MTDYSTHFEAPLSADTTTAQTEEVQPEAQEVETEHTPKAMRMWARENGFQVADKGRISADVKAAYDEAHNLV